MGGVNDSWLAERAAKPSGCLSQHGPLLPLAHV